MKNASDKVVEKIKTYFIFNNFFFLENPAVLEIMWNKYSRAGTATDDNMEHAHCTLHT